jgi:hypothetical protein
MPISLPVTWILKSIILIPKYRNDYNRALVQASKILEPQPRDKREPKLALAQEPKSAT